MVSLPSMKIIVVILFVALIGVSGLAGYLWYSGHNLKNIVQGQDQTEAQKLVSQISKFLILPTDEEPTVATVSDPEVLKDQPFFAGAKLGYKVLIYAKAKKAILYDPVVNKIVNVAPINLDQPIPTVK